MKRKKDVRDRVLSLTSKMPGASWGISAKRCIVGAKLAQVKGTICHVCYALGGRYVMKNVQAAQERRLAEFNSDPSAWANHMVKAISEDVARRSDNRFRWFDSGDVQSLVMLESIADVARRTPHVDHWLPTKEYSFVRAFLDKHGAFPSNLTVRLSAYNIDQKAPMLFGLPGSGTVSDENKSNCNAYKGITIACGPCRKCWSKNVQAVYYPAH